MSGKSAGAERRTAQRIQTHHHVVFSEYRALGPLRTGTAVDRSSGGLRIITSHPEPMGTTIQIELRASTGSPDVLLLEGRVVHLTPMDKGQCAMGIRLIQPALRTMAPAPAARTRRAVAQRTVADAVSAGGPSMGAVPAIAGSAPAVADEAVTFRRIEDGGRIGSWIALVAILMLVVILLVLVLQAMRDERSSGSLSLVEGLHLEGALARFFPQEYAPNAAESKASSSVTKVRATPRLDESPYASGKRPVRLVTLTQAVGAARVSVSPGEISNALYTPNGPIEAPRPAPFSTGNFTAMLDYADRAASRGDIGLARAVVRRAMSRAGGVPAAWRALGSTYERELGASRESGAAPLLSREVSLDSTASAAPSSMRIEVNTTDHLLRVWRGEQMLAEFPVGLGRDDATPRGEFRVGTKARQPAWYSDGRVVPGGAPENPIGAQWLGLAQDGARTSIGIHPTAQPESIGADQSRGCVRMRPEDAETLYRLVPLGAAVTIHS